MGKIICFPKTKFCFQKQEIFNEEMREFFRRVGRDYGYCGDEFLRMVEEGFILAKELGAFDPPGDSKD